MNAAPPTTAVPPAWRAARRVLAVRLDNLGDVLMTTPALAALRETLPGAALTLLASPAGAAAAPHLPMLDDTWSWTAPWMAAHALGTRDAAALGEDEREIVARIAAARFDAAVIFTVCTQSPLPAALMLRAAGVPLRLAHCRENPYALLSDWVRESDAIGDGMRHEVQRQLALVAHVGAQARDDRLRFHVRAPDRDAARQRLAAAGLPPGRPYAVFHPGASAASRRWPAERFGLAAAQVASTHGLAIVFSGDAHEAALIDAARAAMAGPSLSLAGALELGALAALIEGAALLVANNSAPAHIAAALGTPVVELYALTNPQHTPWRVPAVVLNRDVDCRWCLRSACPEGHHRCLQGVDPAEVGDAAQVLLRGIALRDAA